MVGASPAPKVDEMKMLRSLDLNSIMIMIFMKTMLLLTTIMVMMTMKCVDLMVS